MENLCRGIGMPEEVTRQLLGPGICPDHRKLMRPETWEEGLKEIRVALGEDPRGIGMLRCMLRAALDAWEIYEKLGLSREIYLDTMGCFSRFVREHRESYGEYGFDRDFWTVRQVSGQLFRIGQLEYELIQGAVSLHIPTDVQLALPLLRQSWVQAREIIARTFPDWAKAPYVCHSWLLSPDLAGLLPENSRILAFQRSFRVTPLELPCRGVIQWVFKNPKLSPEDYPENTSLQRSLKAFLQDGNTFRDARGTLWADPFL